MSDITVTTFAEAREVYRTKELRQGLYDAGAVVMEGVLVNLHGDEHRQRRRLENRMFRRETFDHYERERFPDIVEQTMLPVLARGRADLVRLGHALMLNLAAVTAGIDRPLGTEEETERLHGYVEYLIEGATLGHSTLDRGERSTVVAAKLDEWRVEFLQPSIDRRRERLARIAIGELDRDAVPRDILSILLQHLEELGMDQATLVREIAFYLLAGAHTSATAFVRTIDAALGWVDTHPEDRERLRHDRLFVQRCVHETIRLNPSSPTGVRRALADITLRSGTQIAEGDLVTIDLNAVNRDPEVFGPDAATFDPTRVTPTNVAPFGLSFAQGMHVCIGQDLAAGVVAHGEDPGDSHLFGLVPVAVQRFFQAGVRRDPDALPTRDIATSRPYWATYPVLLG